MKNPLRKRLLRELRSEMGKYIAIFLLMVAMIGFVSGFLVADESMLIAYEEGFEKYNIEDGNFRTSEKMNKAQRKEIEAQGVSLYDIFYTEEALTNQSTMRIYQNRDEVDLVCVMEGALPAEPGEIAIDRMYADNNGLKTGDTIESGDRVWKITGLIALSDYSCLFSDNNDSMFDAVKFGVGVVAEEEFASYREDSLHYVYAWKYDVPTESEAEEKERSEELMKVVNGEVGLETFIPCYQNQAIQFTGEDMGSDRAMMMVLLYMIMLILAFVFGITTNNTIVKEANVIGTLRASGYTKAELIRHYLSMPLLVTLVSAAVGNVLGYTVFKDVCAGMYYGSYSLPTYVTYWNADAFLETTVAPILLMVLVNLFLLCRKMKLSPLKFLRRDLNRKKQKRAPYLSPRIPFFGRFRMRVILQNAGNYAIMLVGILFANMLLLFGMIFPSILSHYQETLENNLLADYQYILQVPLDALDEEHKLSSMISMLLFSKEVETETPGAEKFSAYSLETFGEDVKQEAVPMYGVEPDSRYIDVQLRESDVYISSAFAEKMEISEGDIIYLKEEYEDKIYAFRVTGIYDYMGGLAVFMNRSAMNRVLELDEEYFSGYFSNTEITDIDSQYISSIIDMEALTKISRQLDVSMGSMMYLVDGFAIAIFLVLIYLLSKIIIERNGQSISMTKILGYTNVEISRLYILSTSIMVILFILLSLPVEKTIMEVLFKVVMMSSISGWIPFYLDPVLYVKIFGLGLVTYLVVALLEYRRVRNVPMEEALKNVE